MLLLLILYFAPFVALALYWRSQSVTASVAADLDAGEGDALGAWDVLKGTLAGRLALVRPVVVAAVASTFVVALADGPSAGAGWVAGAVLAIAFAVLAQSSMLVAAAHDGGESPKAVWNEGSGIALGLASLVAGAVGGIAWFFADPSGVVVLVAFLLGASSVSLFVAMSANGWVIPEVASSSGLLVTEVPAWSLPAPMHAQLAAVAATLLVAATAQPESILGLGGLMAETETLRSELLLLPIAVTLVSPVVAMLTGPLFPSISRSGDGEYFDAERVAALATAAVVAAVVLLGGLSWTLAGAIVVGLAARQVALLADEGALRASRAARVLPGGPAMWPAVVAALALAAGQRMAGVYGIALVALGMTATFATAAACGVSRALFAARHRLPVQASASGASAADAATNLAVTLALLVASGPVLVAESVRRGLVVDLVVSAAPALLLGAVVGAAAAASWSSRLARADDEGDAVRRAARAVAATAVVPALAGFGFGSGAAFGIALGFTAWAAASSPAAARTGSVEDGRPAEEARLRRSVMLAWARTMALAALVAAPLME